MDEYNSPNATEIAKETVDTIQVHVIYSNGFVAGSRDRALGGSWQSQKGVHGRALEDSWQSIRGEDGRALGGFMAEP